MIVNGENLTEKQRMFCEEYLVDLNATQAAKRAGYSEKTAKDIACENLAKPYIKEYISFLKQKRIERVQISQDDVLRIFKQAMTFDIRKLYNDDGSIKKISELDDDTAAAISSIDFDDITLGNKTIGKTTKIKTVDKLKAADLAGRHVGIYEVDNKQSAANITITDENKAILERSGIKVDDNPKKPEGS